MKNHLHVIFTLLILAIIAITLFLVVPQQPATLNLSEDNTVGSIELNVDDIFLSDESQDVQPTGTTPSQSGFALSSSSKKTVNSEPVTPTATVEQEMSISSSAGGPPAEIQLSLNSTKSINKTSAQISGMVDYTAPHISTVKIRFEWSDDKNKLQMGRGESYTLSGTYRPNESLSYSVGSLTPDTLYYYRICASGTDSGSTEFCTATGSFRTVE